MDIIIQSHHAPLSERMRLRAERAVTKVASRMNRVVSATIRFEKDGPVKRVEVVLKAPRRRDLVAEGSGRYLGPALAMAVAKLERQIAAEKVSRRPRPRLRQLARA